MEIRIDDLKGDEIRAFLAEHIAEMRAVSPPGSKHALDIEGLRRPEITFWTLWDAEKLVGSGALKELDAESGEIKSMRVRAGFRRGGYGSALLSEVLKTARERGYRKLYLETGSYAFFEPARALYRRFGFVECGPFGTYRADPNSTFMELGHLREL